MSSKGQIVIPQAVRERCGLSVDDHLVIEDHPEQQTITLRKVKKAEDWFEVLLQCPYPPRYSPRPKQFYRAKNGLAD
jgi:AbrB family looped-hinge helix DNA binding protein